MVALWHAAALVFAKATALLSSAALVVLVVCDKWLQASIAFPGIAILVVAIWMYRHRHYESEERAHVEGGR